MKYRILLTGGGTGGSVTPLLAVADQLRQHAPDIDLLFVGSIGGPEGELCAAANIPFQAIPSGKLRRYWSWKNISDLGNLWRAWRAATKIVRRWPPDVVVSAGSFVAVPVVWAARRTGSRIIIHQQDIRPGLANRLMASAADVITVAFEKSLKDFSKTKVRLIGNPIRPEILAGSRSEAQKIFHLQPGVPTILVVGGGTGSQAINHVLSAAASQLVERWQIIHLTGHSADPTVLHHERYQQHRFLTWEYPHALAIADLVISRAGLGALTECAALGKPTMFIPLPGTHQVENAQLIIDAHAGLVVQQSAFTVETLQEHLERFQRDPSLGQQWSQNIRQLAAPNALEQMVKIILHLVRQ